MAETSPQIQIKPALVPPSLFRLRSEILNSLRLRWVFDMFCSSQDETITIDETLNALDRLGLRIDFADLVSRVSGFVSTASIGLDFDSFENLHRSIGGALFCTDEFDSSQTPCMDESEMREAFNMFDENGDGFISAKELKIVLEKLDLGEGERMDRVEILICSVDRDGLIDFGEFKSIMNIFDVEKSS